MRESVRPLPCQVITETSRARHVADDDPTGSVKRLFTRRELQELFAKVFHLHAADAAVPMAGYLARPTEVTRPAMIE